MKIHEGKQGLGMMRLVLVISTFSPLFLLWAVRGSCLIEDVYFASACVALAVVPSIILAFRIWIAIHKEGKVPLDIAIAEDHREYLLVYLFAILLPMYVVDLNSWRNFWASVFAMLFIFLVFWHADLYYMNLLFTAFHYRVYVIKPRDGTTEAEERSLRILITKRQVPPTGKLSVYRISNFVFFER